MGILVGTMPITMKRIKSRRRSRIGTRTENFSSQSQFYRYLAFLLCWSISVQVSTCSSTVGSTTGSVLPVDNLRSRLRQILLRNHDTTESFGFYYGIPSTVIKPYIGGTELGTTGSALNKIEKEDNISVEKHRYLDEYESIGRDVERWADRMLSEGGAKPNGPMGIRDKDDWNEVFCAKALRSKFNLAKNNTMPMTRQWVKWMKDSREQNAEPGDNQKHPCMKLIATIDAPFPIVCRYLSEKDRFKEYNSLLIDQEDVEILSPHSKICWSQSKKLLFIEPRDFVTYCRHRWLKDGTQLITNQACDHPRATQDASKNNVDDAIDRMSGYRAFSLRGATYISRCPDYPKKRTRMVLLSHCNCGRDVPEWAVRTAVGILAPIKPFEIIYRIQKGIKKNRELLEREEWESITKPKSTTTPDPERSSRPAGIAQMGYACFWPEGGGLVDRSDE